jgi:hypothetical protein
MSDGGSVGSDMAAWNFQQLEYSADRRTTGPEAQRRPVAAGFAANEGALKLVRVQYASHALHRE